MLIDLSAELSTHLANVKKLSEEAVYNDSEESLSSRSSAMNTLTTTIRELHRMQEEIYTVGRLQAVEQVIIETAKEFLSEEQQAIFVQRLDERLNS